MSTDKDALREKAIRYLRDHLGVGFDNHHNIDGLAALLTASVAEAVAQEREACAKIAEMYLDGEPVVAWVKDRLPSAIRVRGATARTRP